MNREMKQPRKDALRDWLRDAADRIEELSARVMWWEDHHEQELQAAIADLKPGPLPFLLTLLVGFLAGAFVVAIYEALS